MQKFRLRTFRSLIFKIICLSLYLSRSRFIGSLDEKENFCKTQIPRLLDGGKIENFFHFPLRHLNDFRSQRKETKNSKHQNHFRRLSMLCRQLAIGNDDGASDEIDF